MVHKVIYSRIYMVCTKTKYTLVYCMVHRLVIYSRIYMVHICKVIYSHIYMGTQSGILSYIYAAYIYSRPSH